MAYLFIGPASLRWIVNDLLKLPLMAKVKLTPPGPTPLENSVESAGDENPFLEYTTAILIPLIVL
jgi:hypothetical protein